MWNARTWALLRRPSPATTHCDGKRVCDLRSVLVVFEGILEIFFEPAIREHFFEAAPRGFATFGRAGLRTNSPVHLVEDAFVVVLSSASARNSSSKSKLSLSRSDIVKNH